MQVTDKMIKAALEAWFGEPVTEPYDEHVDNMRFAIQAAIQAAWVSVGVDFNLPNTGEKVLLRLNGTVQHETYELDCSDNDYTGGDHFWSRDDLDECPLVSIDDAWMPLPEFNEV
jgi:hypothetical protein